MVEPSKVSASEIRTYQAILKKAATIINSRGDGGFPAQAALIEEAREKWQDLPTNSSFPTQAEKRSA